MDTNLVIATNTNTRPSRHVLARDGILVWWIKETESTMQCTFDSLQKGEWS